MNELMTKKEVAEYLKVTTRTVDVYMRERNLPFHKMAGNKYVRYYKSEIDAWLKGE